MEAQGRGLMGGEPIEAKTIHFSQVGSLHDHSLNQLRDHIKQVMIPMLIKTFQYQIELSSSDKPAIAKETCEQLRRLDHDLENLQQWIQNCRQEMQKALSSSFCEEGGDAEKRLPKPLKKRMSREPLSENKPGRSWKNFFLRKGS